MDRNDFDFEYSQLKPQLDKLRTTVFGLLSTGLKNAGIDFFQIDTRTKSSESSWEKTRRKEYDNPFADLTDLVGARIILYLESDIARTEQELRGLFKIDEVNSVNKLDSENVNYVGYRSFHLVASLGSRRESLPEYQNLTELKFEIQIRTALQHAWAEIEHKQNYKSTTSLPPRLQRRLMLASGVIETVDREFSDIVELARNYEKMIENGDQQTRSDPVTTAAIVGIFNRAVKKHRIKRYANLNIRYVNEIGLGEGFEAFNIDTVEDLDELLLGLEKTDVQKLAKFFKHLQPDRLIKFALALKDPYLYFDSLPKVNYYAPATMVKFYEEHYPEVEYSKLCKKYGVRIGLD